MRALRRLLADPESVAGPARWLGPSDVLSPRGSPPGHRHHGKGRCNASLQHWARFRPRTSTIASQEVRSAARDLEASRSCGIMQTMTAISIIIAERAG
ncbi:hypothetical protein [Amycolatopsis sp. NPDC051903]|uniref:hypothetical protein n=1 Tax=Amycolatopsis sp. NPDC051903 TaxID=3363936 RepID=UPI00379BDCD0